MKSEPERQDERASKLAQVRTLLDQGVHLLPATSAQQRFWVLAHSTQTPSFYHVAEAVEVVGELDCERLRRSLEIVVGRHEALRTRIATLHAKPYQVVTPQVLLPWLHIDAPGDRPVEELLREHAKRPFDLSRAPLWRIVVIRLASDRHAILTVFHHLVSDGWSTAVFLRELVQLYMADTRGEQAGLPLPLQYREYEAERLSLATPEREAEQVGYWREVLRDLPKPPTLPLDFARPPGGEASGAWLPFELGERGDEGVRGLAKAAQTTVFGVLLAAFNVMLHTLSGERDLLVGTVVSGRHGSLRWESVLGPLINTLVFRTKIDESHSFEEFLAVTRRELLRMLAHQDLPFERIVELADAPRQRGTMPLTQVGIVYHEYPVRAPQGLPLALLPLPYDTDRAQVDFSLVVVNEEGRLRCRFEYDSRLFREETIRIARNVLLTIVAAASARPRDALRDICKQAFPELLPIHFTQHMRQIWQGEQVFGDALLYRNTVLYTIPAALDSELFLRAAEFVSLHSDGTRSYAESSGGQPRLRFVSHGSGINTFQDFSSEADPQAAFQLWLERVMHRPADLETLPFRTVLARLGPTHHVWYISAHHMFSDGRMVMVLIERVSEVYAALVAGEGEPGEVKYPQIADQLIADLVYQRSARFRKDAQYWAERLRGLGEPLSFYGRSARKSHTVIDRVPYRLGADRSARLLAMATQGMTTAKGDDAFLCNAFGVVLAVYLHKVSGGAKTIAFGSVTHNRRTPESRNVIGLFMQVIPHVLELEEGETFRSLMRKMDREMQAALRYGQYAVESPMGRPIYDVLLNYHKETPVQFNGIQGGYEVLVRRATQSLGVNVTNYDLSGDLELQFDFHREVFDGARYSEIMEHFVAVIDELLRDPDKKCSEVCLLSAGERRRWLVDFNDTRRSLPLERDVYSAFIESTERHGSRGCITDAHASASYRQLMAATIAFAAELAARGVQAGSVVPILAERGIPFLEAVLGLFLLEAAYVPIDPAAPRERIQHIVRECEASVMIVQERFASKLSSEGTVARVRLRAGDERGECEPNAAPHDRKTKLGTGKLAYVIYTSGSTGRPKGAMVTQRGMLNHLYAKCLDLDLGPEDVVVQNASQCFDISVWQYLAPLVCGARTLVVADEKVIEPEAFCALLEQEGATILEVVPSYLRALLDHFDRTPERKPFPTLRYLVATGEALPPDLVRRWLAKRPEVPVVNAYGPTECSDDVTHHFVRKAPAPWEHTVPIGTPIANTQLYVLDEGLQPVPRGVEGELYVGGDGVGLGYLGDNERTRRAFVANGMRSDSSPTLYRTGDRVRMNERGQLEFLGRFDHQIKLRGYRIELGEIEMVLRSHDGVGAAVVVLRDVHGVDALVAYVQAETPAGVSEAELRALALEQLPAYMMPQFWVFLEAIPLTQNGKLDREALPLPSREAPGSKQPAVLNEAEREVSHLWETVLEQPVHDPDGDFFALGGDSLRAIQLLSLAASRGMQLRMQDFLNRPTVRGMASIVRRLDQSVPARNPALDSPGEVPLVGPQRKFLETDHGNPSHDNVAVWLALDVSHVPHLRTAFELLCAERDAFRLSFTRVGTGWKQSLARETVSPVFLRRRLEGSADGERLLASWARETQLSLDISHGVLAAALLIEDWSPGQCLVLVVVHHLVSDAISARLLLARFEEIASDLAEGKPVRPLRATASFSAYARSLRHAVNAGTFDQQQEFWLNVNPEKVVRLGGEAVTQNRVTDQRSLVARIPIAPHSGGAVRAQGHAQALLAALVVALVEWRGPGNHVIGIVGTGREWAPPGVAIEGTVGWFNSYYPLALSVSRGQTPGEIFRAVRAGLSAVPMGGFGYMVLRHLHPNPTLRAALASHGDPAIAFNYLGSSRSERGWPVVELDTGGTRSETNRRLALLHAECWESGEVVSLRLDYNSSAFERDEVAQLLDEWQRQFVTLSAALRGGAD